MEEVLSPLTIKRQTCRHCGKKLNSIRGRKDHERVAHKTKEPESMASLFIQGELNRAMGHPNPFWLEEMLP